MQTVKGKVLKVVKSRPFETKFGPMVNNTITIETENGSSTRVQKLSKPNTDLGLAEGTVVQATYEQFTTETENGTIQSNRIGKDGSLVVFDTSGKEIEKKQYTKGGYQDNSKGQRQGMQVNKTIDLAIALANQNKQHTVTEDNIRTAFSLVQLATSLAEGNSTTTQTKTTKATTKQQTQSEETEEETPFDD